MEQVCERTNNENDSLTETPREKHISSWLTRFSRAALVTLGGLIGPGAQAGDLDTVVPEREPTPVTRKFDGIGLRAVPEAIAPAARQMILRELILTTINDDVEPARRQEAELRLVNLDPGGRETTRAALTLWNELASGTRSWKSEGLERLIQARALGIEYLSRIPYEYQDEIIANRLSLRPDGRPLAVVCYPKGDHNGAYYLGAPMFGELVQASYRVVYYELETDDEFAQSLFEATQLGTLRAQKATLLLVGGHGTRTSLTFERTYGSHPEDRGSIDLGDEDRFNCLGISETLIEGGYVVLDSCSNGEGMHDMDNVANFFRRVFPQAKPLGVWSATESYGPIHLRFDDAGELIEVEYPVPHYRTELERQRIELIAQRGADNVIRA